MGVEGTIMKKIFVWALVGGVIFSIIGNILFNGPLSDIPSILRVGIYFLIFSIILGISLILGTVTSGYDVVGGYVVAFLVSCIVMFLVSMLFEFIYEIDFGKKAVGAGDNYVFIVDNSSSMETNDSNYERYDVLDQIISELPANAEIGVYTYESTVSQITPLGTMASNYTIPDNARSNSGGTSMMTCISTVAKEIENSGKMYNIINLTDGAATDSGTFFRSGPYKSALDTCQKMGIKVSSVGFGTPDESFLTSLAEDTGGVYLNADGVADLYDNIKNAVTVTTGSNIQRTLISLRSGPKSSSILYIILRILFLIIMGVVFSVLKGFASSEDDNMPLFIIVSVIACTIGAILMEALTNGFGIGDNAVRVVLCILWSVAFSPEKSGSANFSDSGGGFQKSLKGTAADRFGSDTGGSGTTQRFF